MDINGADQLVRLSKALKDAGAKDLQRELSKGIRDAVKPAKAAIRQSALDTLPSRGGLNERVANRVAPRIRRSTSGRGGSGVRLIAIGKRGMKEIVRLDRGELRHPVWPRADQTRGEWTWVDQAITPGFWTKPLEALAPEIRREVLASMEAVAKKIDRAP